MPSYLDPRLDLIPLLLYYRLLMSSNKLALIFLGFIFLIILVLSSKRLAAFVRSRFGRYLPQTTPFSALNTTPTPTQQLQKITPSPTKSVQSSPQVKGGETAKTVNNVKTPGEIPATGPTEVVYILLSGSFLGGVALKKISFSKFKD